MKFINVLLEVLTFHSTLREASKTGMHLFLRVIMEQARKQLRRHESFFYFFCVKILYAFAFTIKLYVVFYIFSYDL